MTLYYRCDNEEKNEEKNVTAQWSSFDLNIAKLSAVRQLIVDCDVMSDYDDFLGPDELSDSSSSSNDDLSSDHNPVMTTASPPFSELSTETSNETQTQMETGMKNETQTEVDVSTQKLVTEMETTVSTLWTGAQTEADPAQRIVFAASAILLIGFIT